MTDIPAPPLHPATAVGPVRLTVADLAATTAFYERALGLRVLARDEGTASLGVPGEAPLVELIGRADAAPRAPRSSGLFHLALLVPSREELARAIRRVALARWPIAGASDHLVSEALYLDDPEGNGIEIYRDRPREEWRRAAGGEIEMATLPMDVEGVLATLPQDAGDDGMPAGTRTGHVHLQVGDVAAGEAFYHGVLGFDVVVRGYPGALFLSAGGYHHHIGLNTWASAGGPPADPARRGLRSFTILLPGAGELARVRARVEAAGAPSRPAEGDPDALVVTDPFGNELLLRVVPAPG
jgi:catechol 2,3-dioxygenase